MYGPPRTVAEHRTIVQVDGEACVGCGLCVRACPTGRTLELVDGTATVANPTSCGGCYRCVSRCPANALSMSSTRLFG